MLRARWPDVEFAAARLAGCATVLEVSWCDGPTVPEVLSEVALAPSAVTQSSHRTLGEWLRSAVCRGAGPAPGSQIPVVTRRRCSARVWTLGLLELLSRGDLVPPECDDLDPWARWSPTAAGLAVDEVCALTPRAEEVEDLVARIAGFARVPLAGESVTPVERCALARATASFGAAVLAAAA